MEDLNHDSDGLLAWSCPTRILQFQIQLRLYTYVLQRIGLENSGTRLTATIAAEAGV